MRRRALALAVALGLSAAPTAAHARDDDPWFAADKTAHFGVSVGVAGASYAAFAAALDARGHALLLGAGVTAAVGFTKEGLDHVTGLGHPSWKDLAWDGAGLAVGLAIAWAVDLLVRGVSADRPLLRSPPERTEARARPADCRGIAF